MRFADGQQLEVQRGGKWEAVAARELNQALPAGKPLIDLAYRLPATLGGTVAVSRVPVDVQIQYAPSMHLFIHERGSWLAGTVHNSEWRGTGNQQRLLHFIDTQTHGQLELQLNGANHAPALFADMSTMSRAKLFYTIALKEKHATSSSKCPISLIALLTFCFIYNEIIP